MTSSRTNQQIDQQERMMQAQKSPDFLNPLHEWRRLFAETWGTYLRVIVAAGGGVVSARSGGAITLGHDSRRAWAYSDGHHLDTSG